MNRKFFHDLSAQMENNAQVHQTLVKKVEKELDTNLICYHCTPFHPGGALMDHDPDLIEQMLRGLDTTKHNGVVTLLLTTPGGVPYAAGKIVRVFRTYSKEFKTLVVSRSLSAGTLVCLGSDELIMTETASIGPIDPQMQHTSGNKQRLVGADVIIKSFQEVIGAAQAAIATDKPPDPYYHILNGMDITSVTDCMRAKNATIKIAHLLLANGLLKNSKKTIPTVVDWLIKEGAEEQHGKHLYSEDIEKQTNITVTKIPVKSKLDYLLAELHIRIDRYTITNNYAKYLLSRQGGINVNIGKKG